MSLPVHFFPLLYNLAAGKSKQEQHLKLWPHNTYNTDRLYLLPLTLLALTNWCSTVAVRSLAYLLSEQIGSAGLHHGCDHAGAKRIPLRHFIVRSSRRNQWVLNCVESLLQPPERHQNGRSDKGAAVPSLRLHLELSDSF
eukprot:GHRQ01021581.1.p2 GENE.GHRQ01021581.1~~GHRQ01021581.1.p2  ORF type:complete len:140 (+),score=3.05 GHRQ01021581.1:466-885(+)